MYLPELLDVLLIKCFPLNHTFGVLTGTWTLRQILECGDGMDPKTVLSMNLVSVIALRFWRMVMALIIPAAILQQVLRSCNVKCQNFFNVWHLTLQPLKTCKTCDLWVVAQSNSVYFVKLKLVGEAEGSGNNEWEPEAARAGLPHTL